MLLLLLLLLFLISLSNAVNTLLKFHDTVEKDIEHKLVEIDGYYYYYYYYCCCFSF